MYHNYIDQFKVPYTYTYIYTIIFVFSYKKCEVGKYVHCTVSTNSYKQEIV